jgi:hypothetical protein
MKTRKVKSAVLHQPVTVPGLVAGERTLNPLKLSPGVTMSWTLHGLLLSSKTKEALVPAANVAVMEFES